MSFINAGPSLLDSSPCTTTMTVFVPSSPPNSTCHIYIYKSELHDTPSSDQNDRKYLSLSLVSLVTSKKSQISRFQGILSDEDMSYHRAECPRPIRHPRCRWSPTLSWTKPWRFWRTKKRWIWAMEIWKSTLSNRKYIYKWWIFHRYFSLREGNTF